MKGRIKVGRKNEKIVCSHTCAKLRSFGLTTAPGWIVEISPSLYASSITVLMDAHTERHEKRSASQKRPDDRTKEQDPQARTGDRLHPCDPRLRVIHHVCTQAFAPPYAYHTLFTWRPGLETWERRFLYTTP